MCNPFTKTHILRKFRDYLYIPFEVYATNQIEAISKRNMIFSRKNVANFRYKGKVYSYVTDAVARFPISLHKELHTVMDELWNEIDYVENYEQPRVLGFLTYLLNETTAKKDLLLILPDSLHSLINNLNMLGIDPKFSTAQVEQIIEQYGSTIQLIKARLVNNLLL